MEQSEIPVIVKHHPAVDVVPKAADTILDQGAPVKNEERIVPSEDNDSPYLKLTGNENECVFSSTAPGNKPTVNVSYHIL